jgi:uncharacterized beta-barrel protein YwiB (DUF1934 family)
MKEIKIRSIVTNSENETTNIEAIGKYDKEQNIITFSEEEYENTIYILKDCVKINRKNQDYNLNLEFKLNEKLKCKYEIKSLGIDIDIVVLTKMLEITETYIYIDYELLNEEENIGSFEYKLIFWE